MAPRAKESKAKGSKAKGSKGGAKKARSPRCRTCNQTIRVPKGWSTGPAVRRHYWAKHREVMQGKARS